MELISVSNSYSQGHKLQTSQFFMEEQPVNILNEVRSYLIRKGEEFEWICSPQHPYEKIGIAFVQLDSTLPCSFLFSWKEESQVFSLDVLFATKIPEESQLEMTLILSKLNYNLNKGRFVQDLDGGYLLYRQSSSIGGLNLTKQQIWTLISNMEKQGLKTAEEYSDILEDQFKTFY